MVMAMIGIIVIMVITLQDCAESGKLSLLKQIIETALEY